MSSQGDGGEDMFVHHDLDAAVLDAVLANEVIAPGDEALAAFLSDVVLIASTSAPAPSRALAQILTGAASIPPADAVSPSCSRTRRLLGRVASIGVAAKISLAAVAAGAAITTAGVTHHLPGPAQRVFEDVVNNATPWTIAHRHAPQAPPPAPGPATASSHPPGVPSRLVPSLPQLPSQATSPPVAGVPPSPSRRPSVPPRPTPSSRRPTPSRPAPPSTPHPSPPVVSSSRTSPPDHR